MAGDLIEMFSHTVAEPLVRQASSMLGESADNLSKSIRDVPTLLMARLIQKTGTPSDFRQLLNHLEELKASVDILPQVQAFLQNPVHVNELMSTGSSQLQYLLGDELPGVVDAIAGGHNLSTSSASSLLKLTTPLFLQVVGKYIREKSLDTQGIQQLLRNHLQTVREQWPEGLSLPDDLISAGQVASASQNTFSEAASVQTSSPLSKYVPWLILMLTSLALFYLVEKGCGGQVKPDETHQEEAEQPDQSPATMDTSAVQ